MRRAGTALLATAAMVAGFLAAPAAPARAAQCPGVPDSLPLYVEYAQTAVTFRDQIFRRPGLVLATSGIATPRTLREGGAATIYWEIDLPDYVGTPDAPASPASVPAAAANLLQTAKESSACATPLIALNEFLGSRDPGPFSGGRATYRQNVLSLLQALAAGGARPFLLLSSPVSVSRAGAAGFWQQASQHADLVPEIYFNAKTIYAQGPIVGNRNVRIAFRQGIGQLAALGIAPARLGIMLGFQSSPGQAGREGLTPLSAWLQVVKWQALAARTVAADGGIGSVWSWGWGTFPTPGSADPDKPVAACTYLWARDPSLCDAPALAGANLNTNRTEGQLNLPARVQCTWTVKRRKGRIAGADVARVTRLTGGNRARALSALFELAVTRGTRRVSGRSVSQAERAIVAARYDGRSALYSRALRRKRINRKLARAVIADQLVRRSVVGKARGKQATARFKAFLVKAENAALQTAFCQRDELPAVGEASLLGPLPFLKLASPRTGRRS